MKTPRAKPISARGVVVVLVLILDWSRRRARSRDHYLFYFLETFDSFGVQIRECLVMIWIAYVRNPVAVVFRITALVCRPHTEFWKGQFRVM